MSLGNRFRFRLLLAALLLMTLTAGCSWRIGGSDGHDGLRGPEFISRLAGLD